MGKLHFWTEFHHSFSQISKKNLGGWVPGIDESLDHMRKIESSEISLSISKNEYFHFSSYSSLLIFESEKTNLSFYSQFPRVLYWNSVIMVFLDEKSHLQVTSTSFLEISISVHKNMSSWILFLLSKHKIRFSNFSFFSRIRDENLKFLFLLSKFEIRVSNFSFYSWNSRSEF